MPQMLGVLRYHEVYSKEQGQILGCVLPYEDAYCLYKLIIYTIFLHYGRNGYICSKFRIIGIMQVPWSTYSYVHMEFVILHFKVFSWCLNTRFLFWCVLLHIRSVWGIFKDDLKTGHSMVNNDPANWFIQWTAAYTTWKYALGRTF